MDEDNRDINLNFDTWQLQQIIEQVMNTPRINNISIDHLPTIDVNITGGSMNTNHTTTESVMRDERSKIEQTRATIETLLSAVKSEDAKAALDGSYSALNNALEKAYQLLKHQLQEELDNLMKSNMDRV